MARPTPADVGKRISLRYLLPGGGQSEAVGHLQSWSGGELVVRRKDGTDLRLGEHLVVAARIVPEAPPRRGRPRLGPPGGPP